VTVVRRVLTVAEGPLAYLVDNVPRSILGPRDVPDSFDGSVLDLLLDDHDLHPDRALANIVPLTATPSLARKLDLEVGEPLLLLEETLFGQAGRPLGTSRNYFVPGFFNFSVMRRRV
jgi:GntR family transcriptional regulator